jgi:hypothetical protein
MTETKLPRKITVAGFILALLLGASSRNAATNEGSGPALDIISSEPKQVTGTVAPGQTKKLAGEVYKNIQVFKDVPASQILGTMSFISVSLGVSCSYCHLNEREIDAKPTKLTARKMILMVRTINQGDYGSEGGVTCYTCHQGQPKTRPAPSPTLNAPHPLAEEPEIKPFGSMPSAAQTLDRYVRALGGRDALAKLTTRISSGTRINADGTKVPTEVKQKAPNKLKVSFNSVSASNIFYSVYDGAAGWSGDTHGLTEMSDELLTLVQRDSEFYAAASLKDQYRNMKLLGKTVIEGRDCYVIKATAPDGSDEKWYFDGETALLTRRNLEIRTVLGRIPIQIDFGDYTKVDEVLVPFSIRWSRPGLSWGRKLSEVKHNVPVDDDLFSNTPIKK